MPRRTIVVTGGAGHVGSHVIEQLVGAGNDDRIISFDDYSNGSRSNHIAGAEYRVGNTRDIATLMRETPDLLFHLGEYARIATSFEDVATVYYSNIMGTFAVAEFCRQRAVPKLVYAASSTRFAIEGDGRHQNPYSFTKATNVDLINDYARWYNLPSAICYFYNAFGPREVNQGKYATLIAKFERQYRAGEPLTVTLPGTQRRAFTYVKDLARGIILVGEGGSGDGYALRADNSYSILEIAQAFGGEIKMIDEYSGRADVTDDPTSKVRDELGWRPTVDVLDYIRDFKEHVQS
ncbi:MAG: NAD-dependent epimerase/dehydratase family protein [Gemmatimonadaceae bacterium]